MHGRVPSRPIELNVRPVLLRVMGIGGLGPSYVMQECTYGSGGSELSYKTWAKSHLLSHSKNQYVTMVLSSSTEVVVSARELVDF